MMIKSVSFLNCTTPSSFPFTAEGERIMIKSVIFRTVSRRLLPIQKQMMIKSVSFLNCTTSSASRSRRGEAHND